MSKIKSYVMDIESRLDDSQQAERRSRLELAKIDVTIMKLKESKPIEDEELLTTIDDRLNNSLELVNDLEALLETGNALVKDFGIKIVGKKTKKS